LYIFSPKEEKKAYKLGERIQEGCNIQFVSEKEEELYKDYLPGSIIFQISITSCSKLRIMQGSRHWKDPGQQNINVHPEN
jgi:hypothetical protein